MKKMIALSLCVAVFLSGCFASSIVDTTKDESATSQWNTLNTDKETTSGASTTQDETQKGIESESSFVSSGTQEYKEIIPSFNGIDDPKLLDYVEYSVYSNLVHTLDSDNYFVQNVKAVYISQEYIDELSYNSQSNIFFGYTLEELDHQFQGDRYVFSLSDTGETTAVRMETVYDDSTERIIKNVAIGGGVILLCVTVSVVSAGTAAPAVSMIFAASAKTGATFALSSSALGGVAATITTAYQTHDPEAAFKAGLLAGSEGFKWGAISGAVLGGAS